MDIAITGRGLITPLGIGLPANEAALRAGRSGIVFMPEWRDRGLESQVAGVAEENPPSALLDAKNLRFTTPNARMAVAAAEEALREAKLTPAEIRGRRIAVILGSAGSTHEQIYEGGRTITETGRTKKLTPFTVPRVMASSAVASLSLILGVTGESYDISSACTSGAHAIMIASRLIAAGAYDLVITGGTEEVNWLLAGGFDAMRAISRRYNDRPHLASRPFDRDRDGFVIAAGAGILVMETPEHARARGVETLARITGVGANSNAADMVVPVAESNCEVMALAIADAGLTPTDIDYINTHGTSTPTGDPVELAAIRQLFGDAAGKVAINSTKSMTGHMIGATGAVETIFCTQMIRGRFISPNVNLENPEPGFEWADLPRTCREDVTLRHALSNSFGFGGTNGALVISAP
jgi:3-oxoacyl-[acyl-carrier-protein] synthase-1